MAGGNRRTLLSEIWKFVRSRVEGVETLEAHNEGLELSEFADRVVQLAQSISSQLDKGVTWRRGRNERRTLAIRGPQFADGRRAIHEPSGSGATESEQGRAGAR